MLKDGRTVATGLPGARHPDRARSSADDRPDDRVRLPAAARAGRPTARRRCSRSTGLSLRRRVRRRLLHGPRRRDRRAGRAWSGPGARRSSRPSTAPGGATAGTVTGRRAGGCAPARSAPRSRPASGWRPEERKSQGLLLDERGLPQHHACPAWRRFARGGFLDRRCRAAGGRATQVEALDVRPADVDREVRTLSGGNQQKVVLARWLLRDCRVLLLDEPTRGVDVGARSEIYALIRALADRGVAVVVVSSEIEEVLGLADRVLVVARGRRRRTRPGRTSSTSTGCSTWSWRGRGCVAAGPTSPEHGAATADDDEPPADVRRDRPRRPTGHGGGRPGLLAGPAGPQPRPGHRPGAAVPRRRRHRRRPVRQPSTTC